MMNKKKTGKRRRATGGGQRAMLRQHRRSVVIVCTVLGLLVGVMGIGSVRLYAKNESYKQQEADLLAQIKEAEAKAEEVKAYEEYVKTDEYIKDVAEEKLGLVDLNEIIFKPQR